jgi:HPt (histidine-containing phosphotransfer) domain-containing protein
VSALDPAAWQDFVDLFAGDATAISEIVTIFIEESHELEAKAVQGLDAQDADAVRRAGHSLKSTSRQLGAVTLGNLAAQLEELGRAEDITGAEALRVPFVVACANAREALASKI